MSAALTVALPISGNGFEPSTLTRVLKPSRPSWLAISDQQLPRSDDPPIQIGNAIDRERALVDDQRSIQHPHAQLTRCVILPDDIRSVVRIHVANAADVPVQISSIGAEQLGTDDIGSAHRPDSEPPSRPVLPDEIRIAIAVRITGPGDLPVGVRDLRDTEVARGDDLLAIHQPRSHPATGSVLPNQVGLAVTVDITNSSDFPVEVGHAVDTQKQRAHDIRPRQVPDRQPTFRSMLPYEIGVAVTVQITAANHAPVRVGDAIDAEEIRAGDGP